MPTCYLDISRLMSRACRGRLATGVDRVCLAYMERWRTDAHAVLMRKQWRRILDAHSSQALFKLLLEPPTGDDLRRSLNWEVLKACVPPWPSQHAHGKWAFYLGHWGLEFPAFAEWVQTTCQKPIFFIHDLIPLTHPEYCRPGESDCHAVRMRVALTTGAGLLLNSRHTLDQLKAWADQQALPMPPAAVAPLAAAPLINSMEAKGLSDAPLRAPYFVMLGTIEPRKNHLLLLELWRDLVISMGGMAPQLVVIGQRGWECENVVDMLERCTWLKEHVHEVSSCTDAELARYLRHAKALLFPTFSEGYGMPLAEALTAGTPVIASDLPVFKEFAGNVPEWLSPVDGLGWKQAILDYTEYSHPRRLAQLARLKDWQAPTWGDHFEAVDDLLERLA